MGGMGGMMLWMLVWGLVGLALLALTVVGIVWLVRRGNGTNRLSPPESPDEILSRRYAAGELDEDEYLRRRAGLQD
ncbi:MAG: SHOCT domain-containing protein [Nocardioidaceae bacterium]|nr:SHOCT domain-containing protein [Nocardioidaceae bacterium]